MGARGKLPQPTDIKAIAGKKYEYPKKKPKPRSRIKKEPPIWLNELAKAEWRRMRPLLKEMGILYDIDSSSLEAYCDNYALMIQCEIELQQTGLTYVSDKGTIHAYPQVAIKNRAAGLVKSFSQEFGFTPAARTRVDIEAGKKKKKEGGILALIGGGKK